MIELPEALTIAAQLQENVIGKTVSYVLPPTKLHKFCWYNGEPVDYNTKIKGQKAVSAEAFGIYAELTFSNGYKLAINDGVNVRLIKALEQPKNYQLLIGFTDGSALVFTVSMYGAIILHKGEYDNEYYRASRQALSPFSEEFPAYYRKLLTESKPTLSLKAFLATEQRFPGIGNGVLQDILFAAHLNPRRKIQNLDAEETEQLLTAMVDVLKDMVNQGGRDTEKTMYGNNGAYKTQMSKHALAVGCPICGGEITKETYLGGAIYYCPVCQKLHR